jgi:hypothetical protein
MLTRIARAFAKEWHVVAPALFFAAAFSRRGTARCARSSLLPLVLRFKGIHCI